jgi:4-hydroxyacetophenone monooxygenase
MEPRQDVHDVYNEKIDAENAQMAWGMEGVTNWYKSESGRVSQSWPFPLIDYWQACRMPVPDDFIFHK